MSNELNVLRKRGPRRLHCVIHSIHVSSIQEGGAAPTPTSSLCLDENTSSPLIVRGSEPSTNSSSPNLLSLPDALVLKNKAPRWHEQLQCWCLNFRGRVTVASVKNFQIVAAVDTSLNIPAAEQGKVILQFGKIGKEIFTMDYPSTHYLHFKHLQSA